MQPRVVARKEHEAEALIMRLCESYAKKLQATWGVLSENITS